MERQYQGPERGWGLVATADIPPDDVILSVPLPAAITSAGALESEWSLSMAEPILQALQQRGKSNLEPWMAILPDHIPLPWLYWRDTEIEALQDPDTVNEAFLLQQTYSQALERYGGAHSEEAIAWALSLVHSRSFISSGAHVWVPGVDLCNHTLDPNARVRLRHSPGACQGAAATEEVAPPPPPEPSRFELIAGEAGVAAGQEVTISYGSWPNDVFLLFFGFVPPPGSNPNDAVCLFADVAEVLSFLKNGAPVTDADVMAVEEALGAPAAEFERLVVTAEGLDGRVPAAVAAALAAVPSGAGGSVEGVLAARCRQMLDAFPTTLEEDAAALAAAAEADGAAGSALRYRMGKKAILGSALAHFT